MSRIYLGISSSAVGSEHGWKVKHTRMTRKMAELGCVGQMTY